jgi:hypothetical protein
MPEPLLGKLATIGLLPARSFDVHRWQLVAPLAPWACCRPGVIE